MAILKFLLLQTVLLCLLFIPVRSVSANPVNHNSFLYVSLRGENAVLIYKIDPGNGALEKIHSETVSGGPASIAAGTNNKYLYIAQRTSNRISAYRTNPENGMLTLINSVTAVDNPVYLSTDQSGNYLLSAYFNANKAAVYPLSDDGSINGIPTQTFSSGTNPHAILTDPANRFLYLTNMTGNKIQQFRFDSLNGKFSALEPAEFLPPVNTGPRHMVFHSKKPLLYVANELGNSVTVYQVNNEFGNLSALQTITTLPDGFSGSSKCADIHLTPDNRFVYASNRGHESLAAFETDTVTGLLSKVGIFPTVKSPREFAIDPSGSFLYAAGETSNDLACYRINHDNGKLDSLFTIPVGKNPSWVVAVDLSETSSSAQPIPFDEPTSGIELIGSPNPFFDSLTISFSIDKPSHVKITIADQTSREVAVLQNETLTSGKHSINWNTLDKSLPNGIYLCTIETETGLKTVKLVKGE